MKSIRYRSLVRRVVLIPMTVMAFLVCVTIGASVAGYIIMQQRMVDNYLNTLGIALNRLEMRMGQVDNELVEFLSNDVNHIRLRSFDLDTPVEEYAAYLGGVSVWMIQVLDAYSETEGMFVYYRNLDRLLMRGRSNTAVHAFIQERLEQTEGEKSRWVLVDAKGNMYLVSVKEYQNFVSGVWMAVDEIRQELGLEDENYPGTVYLQDQEGHVAVADERWDTAFIADVADGETFYTDWGTYRNQMVSGSETTLSVGLLLSESSLLEEIPLLSKGILLLAVGSIALVPMTALWLRRRIAEPVKELADGMRRLGAGDMDYRIPLEDKTSVDEFDRLKYYFNLMTDQLNDLEYRLYISKIKQQRTELKYISQQIRPHFILNALNLIYTYEEKEFPLVKKMVLYLSEYFRYIVNLRVDFVSLLQEMRHVKNYLRIQKERYLDRFDFVVEWEAQLSQVPIPPLIIQTFVENCIKHGMKNHGKTLIYVLAEQEEKLLKLTVSDAGQGFPSDKIRLLECFLSTRQTQDGLGVGIQNAVERLDMLYERRIDIRFYNRKQGGAVVELLLPLHPPEKEGTADV